MLKIVSLIAFLFCQLVAEACPSLSRSSAAPGGDARGRAAVTSVAPAAATDRAAVSRPAGAAAPAPTPREAACVSMTVIRAHPRRNRHEELRLRGWKEIS
jgi:hypothetical protein